MTILGADKLAAFKKRHPEARASLGKWESVVTKATWKNIAELKNFFNSADYVRGLTVFDIGGNKYRMIAIVQYETGLVIVKDMLTHEEYDRGGWK